MRKTTVNIQPYFIILGVFTALIIPLKFIIAWLIAAAVHEIGHLVSLMILGKQVYSIDIGCCGARIRTDPLTIKEECIAGFAGPFAGFLLLFFVRIFPLVAIYALIQTVYNLLPIYPMDGGRVILSVIQLFAGKHIGMRIYRYFTFIFLVLIILFVLNFTIQHISGWYLMIFILFIIIKTKIACKRRLLAVQ